MDLDFGETPESEISQSDYSETDESIDIELNSGETFVTGDYGSNDTPENNSNRTIIIIVAVVLVILCCCCLVVGGGLYWLWINGDRLLGLAFEVIISALTLI